MQVYILLIGLLPASLHAQTVRGMAADENIGATVMELGTQNDVITDINGEFELQLTRTSARFVIYEKLPACARTVHIPMVIVTISNN